jgi:hypothetical protein
MPPARFDPAFPPCERPQTAQLLGSANFLALEHKYPVERLFRHIGGSAVSITGICDVKIGFSIVVPFSKLTAGVIVGILVLEVKEQAYS